MKLTDSVYYAGVNDRKTDLFEGQYAIPEGMAYNSHVIIDEKIAVLDTVDADFKDEWLRNIAEILDGRKPDYLVVHHMEPDHSANIMNFLAVYPEAKVVASAKAFSMMNGFFGKDLAKNGITVAEGSKLPLGNQTLTFYTAPMVHWPEVVVSYLDKDKILFAADAFGKFGTRDAKEEWADEARRYYFGIVGKYGTQAGALLKKLAGLEINMICSLHGPTLTDNLGYYIDLYKKWTSYTPETDGVFIAYTSVYGNTKHAAEELNELLKTKGVKTEIADLARSDMSQAVANAFRYDRLVLATTTYNADIFPFMRTFIENLTERNYKNRRIALIENGTWAPMAKKVMTGLFEKSKDITWAENNITIKSSMTEENENMLKALAEELAK